MTTMKELERTFSGLGKYISVEKGGNLAVVSTGNNRYVIGIFKKGETAYSALTSHLTKKELQELIWEYTRLLSHINMGILKLR